MPLPSSREEINRLGRRLAAADPISDVDLQALEELAACHMTALELARPRLDGLAEQVGVGPLHITHRAKTTQTILEKLRREQGMNLARVQDLAGIRIVGGMSLDMQNRVTSEIATRFPADPREARIVDRRAETSHGYRAVHVVVSLDGVLIEIQVRTVLQHLWANLMERLADRLGRQIRYGGAPVPPAGASLGDANNIVISMMSISRRWAERESTEDHPIFDPASVFHLDELADELWKAVSDTLRETGIDL